MIRIAICDDEQPMVDALKKRFDDFFKNDNMEYEINLYTNGNQLLEDNNKNPYDVLFLDIDMPQIDGIKVAKNIRNVNSNMIIIFVTNKENLVFQSIKYSPFRFIRKDNLDEDIRELFFALKEKIILDNIQYEVIINGKIKFLTVSKIVYFESFRHNIIAHYFDATTYNIKESLSNLSDKFGKYGFIRVHKSYLVNYRNIYVINSNNLKLDTNENIPISRFKRQEIQTKYKVFLRR